VNWTQLKTILWLRWRLTRNQLFRGSKIGGALLIVLGVLGAALIVTICTGATFAGFVALRTAKPNAILITWTVVVLIFLFLWMMGLMVELQRSETIDLQKLMHLPVRLGQVFVINYIASHATFSLLMLVPGMIGLVLGLTFGRSTWFLLLLPLVVTTLFMVTAWTYCLRGWIAAMMHNPRRRRTIIMCVTLCFILIGQGPNIYFNVIRRGDRPPRNESAEDRAKRMEKSKAEGQRVLSQLEAAENFIPPLWLPLGAKGAAERNPLPAVLGTFGCFGLGVLGLRRAYRTTVRFYQGDTGKKAVVGPLETRQKSPTKPSRSGLIELQLPRVPGPAAAVAGATLRSMLRAPEVKMALGTSTIVVLVVIGTAFMRAAPRLPAAGKPFMVTGAAVFALFLLFQFISNQFGHDREGFRILVMSPVDRRQLLLGKNLAMLPVAALFGVGMVLVVSLWLGVPPLTTVATLLQLAAMSLFLLMYGNLLSILIPFRIQAGTMKPTKPPFLKMLGMIFAQFAVPIILAPGAVPPLAEFAWQHLVGSTWVPVNFLASVLLLAVAAISYWLALTPLASLYTRREEAILRSVTSEAE